MNISELKNHLDSVESLNFIHTDGRFIPPHFHITEVGLITKHFIDCGGTIRTDKVANIQIWVAEDVEHRLTPKGLLNILDLSYSILGDEDLKIEIEYQTDTIGKYGLAIKDDDFVL